jgi:transcriptional regulator with XRE-family HTH domain
MINIRIKEIRTDNKLTQEEFAINLNLKQTKIRDIEAGKQKVSVEIAENIEDIYKINLRWLLTGRGDKYIGDCNGINVQNHNGTVAVNGTITINTNDYADSDEIKELLEILKDVPKSWIDKILIKLQKSLKAIDEEF